MNNFANLASIEPALAEVALRYKWPKDEAKVTSYLKAISLFHTGSELREIGAAMGIPARRVSTMLEEVASITHEVSGIRKEFRVIPYQQLMKILPMHDDGPMQGRRGESPVKCDFSTVDKMRTFFSVSPLPATIPNLGRQGEKIVREALGIKLSPVRAYKVSHSATTIKAAIAIVERNFADPLVQAAVARWRTIL